MFHKIKSLLGAALILLFIVSGDCENFSGLEVHFIDVPHGDAILLRSEDINILIESGYRNP